MGGFDGKNGFSRAWVEIDLDALAHNAGELKALLPQWCELMAVVKSDAYGHGAVSVSHRLWGAGVRSFAVATADEGVALRRSGLEGTILVLGYTPACEAAVLEKYGLEQLVVDGAHAAALDKAGHKLRVHIAVDTGMHRLGIQPGSLSEIESVFRCGNLTVAGIGSHLSVPDSIADDDVDFTNLQIRAFYDTVNALEQKGYDAGKLHVQASYGVCNYSELQCGYARVGIMLYGVMSDDSKVRLKPSLRPVLSLRARIAQVRRIGAGESVSYGRIFKSEKPTNLATVSIGYADGVPRQMSGNGGMCIVNGVKVPIAGRICMDLLMIDVTAAGPVQPGDVVTLIGKDGGAEIKCEEFAAAAGTITNDVLCRLGSRLARIEN